jgi:diguanylate cyclase (GGDEF)-like protein
VSRGWSTHQLTEFLAGVSSSSSVESACRTAVELAAEVLEAEVGALVQDRGVLATVGFRSGAAPVDSLLQAASSTSAEVELPVVGRVSLASAPLDSEDGSVLLVARLSCERFDREDVNLLRGMARALALTLRMQRLVDEERALRKETQRQADDNARLLSSLDERRRLLEQLERLQGSISRRAPLQDVLDEVVDGAVALLGEPIAALRLIDSDDPSSMVTISSRGLSAELERITRRSPSTRGAAGLAATSGSVVAIDDYNAHPAAAPDLAVAGVTAALAAPVHEHGTVVGGLLVASLERSGGWSDSERELMAAYASHVSLALAAAKTVDTMRQAFNDPLTGLANRTLFSDRLEHALARAERSGTQVTVLFLDLDRFKVVNDSLGHAAGDELLIAVAGRLRSCLRKAETAARLGGDEFAVLLEDSRDPDESKRVAERMLAVLRDPFMLHDNEVFITTSIGIASGREEADDLLRNADVAMYKAKASGKDRYEVFEPGMHAAAVARLELEADLQRALERDELVLHYQPLVALATGAILGLEALVRWRHPRRGLVPPMDFIPLTEETGLIMPIGRWILGEACRQLARWQVHEPDLVMNVNLSGCQLQSPGLEHDVRSALETSGVAPASLVLEITETTLMHDSEASVGRLQALKRLGVRLAIDDFGTGYSSLRYLHRFPIDLLKIPKPFVDSLAARDDEGVLVRSIVALSSNLGLATVAEGIEEPLQITRLLEHGCALGQGFLFSRPVEADAATALLAGASRRAA